MANKFEHIKRRSGPRSLDEFIGGAGKDENAKITKRKTSSATVLLSITGRANLEEYEKPGLVYIRKDIQADIEKYCRGSKQAIVNYLLRKGLDYLIKEGKTIIENQE